MLRLQWSYQKQPFQLSLKCSEKWQRSLKSAQDVAITLIELLFREVLLGVEQIVYIELCNGERS